MTNSDIFWKTWLWSVICGIAVASLFWMISGVLPIFNWLFDYTGFVDILIALSIAGTYFGAGYVGWRIAEKYYHDYEKRFVRRYVKYSVLSFILLVAIVFSPLSFLGILWSLVAPFCAVKALSHIKKQHR